MTGLRLSAEGRRALQAVLDADTIARDDTRWLQDGWFEPAHPEPDNGAVVLIEYDDGRSAVTARRDEWSSPPGPWFQVGSTYGATWFDLVVVAVKVTILEPRREPARVEFPVAIKDPDGDELVFTRTGDVLYAHTRTRGVAGRSVIIDEAGCDQLAAIGLFGGTKR